MLRKESWREGFVVAVQAKSQGAAHSGASGLSDVDEANFLVLGDCLEILPFALFLVFAELKAGEVQLEGTYRVLSPMFMAMRVAVRVAVRAAMSVAMLSSKLAVPRNVRRSTVRLKVTNKLAEDVAHQENSEDYTRVERDRSLFFQVPNELE